VTLPTCRAPQVSEQSKHIAAQASTYSSVAAQRATDAKAQAQAQLAGMHLPDALANLKLPADGDAEPPSPEELAVYGIDGDFCAFVRGLTYSTFRQGSGAQHECICNTTCSTSWGDLSTRMKSQDGAPDPKAFHGRVRGAVCMVCK